MQKFVVVYHLKVFHASSRLYFIATAFNFVLFFTLVLFSGSCH